MGGKLIPRVSIHADNFLVAFGCFGEGGGSGLFLVHNVHQMCCIVCMYFPLAKLVYGTWDYPRLLFMGRVFLQTILVAFGCGGGIVTIHDIYYYSLPLLATNTSIVKYTNRKACLCTINFVSAHSYGSISFMGTVFLLNSALLTIQHPLPYD